MSDKLQNIPEISQSPETNQDILAKQSEKVRKIVENDRILQKNLDQITNPTEFFEKLAQNTHIFEQTDNLTAQKTFLEQSLKGLGYGQYTKDGREFVKLTDEEVVKLDDTDAEKYLAWLEKKENEQKQKTIKTAGEADKEGEKVIALEKDRNAAIENKKIIDTLSGAGKNLIDTEFQKAKTDEKNPVYRDLISKGVDPSKGDFDNILRASIILANAGELLKESKNQKVFSDSISKLGELGIPYPVKSDIPSISAHIDSRFPRSESTERAKGEIARSIASGSVASIYYDGNGEKYTLIDKDGKTSKEVSMNPPRIRVVQNGFEAEDAIVPSADTKKRAERLGELGTLNGKTQEKIRKISTDLGGVINGDNTEYKEFLQNPAFSENFPVISDPMQSSAKRIESIEKLIQIYRSARDKPTINKDLYEQKIQEFDDIKNNLQKEATLQGAIANIPTVSSDDFESNIKTNFSTLADSTHLYNRFPRAQELLTEILGEINRNRNPRNQIQLGEKVLNPSDKQAIDMRYTQVLKSLGTDASILKSADIGTLGPKMNDLLKNSSRQLKKILQSPEAPLFESSIDQ